MTQRQVSLLVLTTVLGATGGDRWLYVLEARWADLGLRVTHLHLTGSSATDMPMPPRRVRVVAASRTDRRARSDLLRVLRTMWRETGRADVVLLEPQGVSAPVAFLMAKLRRRPTAIYSQGVAELSFDIWEPNKVRRRLIRFMWLHVDAIMCVSPGSVEGARRQGVAWDKIVEVRTAVDIDDIRRRAAGPRVLPALDRPVLVACGAISVHKGFDRIILAASELKDRGVLVDLVIVGAPGDDYDRITSLVDSHDLGERVTFVTHGPDAVQYIACADAFVHAARYDTVGLVLLEALSLGVPVIALDEAAGGPRLVLDDGAYGRLLPGNASPREFADAVQAHLDDPDELRARAAEAENHVRQHFSVPRAAEASATVLCRLGQRRTTAVGPPASG